MKKILLSFVVTLFSLTMNAEPIEINGVFYNLIAKANVAEVAPNPNKYKGYIEIPDSVIYDNVVYYVKSINEMAFFQCPSVRSVIMPNSVNSIGKHIQKI